MSPAAPATGERNIIPAAVSTSPAMMPAVATRLARCSRSVVGKVMAGSVLSASGKLVLAAPVEKGQPAFDGGAARREGRGMPLHMIKLCVGVETVDEIVRWIDEDLGRKRRLGLPAEDTHVTRMMPRRIAELLDGGSLYWVVKGQVQCRQRLLDLRAVTGVDGIERCEIVFDPEVILTEWQPKRPFQGWRYLEPKDAPRDLAAIGGAGDDLPSALKAELAELGLL